MIARQRLLPALVTLAVLMPLSACTSAPTPHAARPPSMTAGEEGAEAEDDGLAEEQEEQAEQAAQHKAGQRAAREAGTFGRTGHFRWIETPGWARAKLRTARYDDWEPSLAVDPHGGWVYQAATRYYGPRACKRCPRIAIVLRASRDGGRTWGPDRYVCPCPGQGGQYDSQIEVASDGTIYAAWLIGYTPGVTFSKSADHGKTWTDPVNLPSPRWSDKPVLGISRDGQDVYIAFNGPFHGDSYIAQSHDAGATFTSTMLADTPRYFFAGSSWVSHQGRDIVFAEDDFNQGYTGDINIDAVISHDHGHTWQTVRIDTVRRQPDCTSYGCYDGFYGSVPGLGGDDDGHLTLAYVGASVPAGPQRLYVTRSSDGGLTWDEPTALSPERANALSPTVAARGRGDVRMWWMDDRTGQLNVWYRSSEDGGLTWTAPVRLSNAIAGVRYVGRRGFREMYGDYGEIAIDRSGHTLAIWGEGPDLYGPGGAWFNRQR
jgi:hypothetical protein